jgi:hypothetical protein
MKRQFSRSSFTLGAPGDDGAAPSSPSEQRTVGKRLPRGLLADEVSLLEARTPIKSRDDIRRETQVREPAPPPPPPPPTPTPPPPQICPLLQRSESPIVSHQGSSATVSCATPSTRNAGCQLDDCSRG